MKHSGTLKLEIVSPVESWRSDAKQRLFALRKTAAQGLTMTMQDLHGDAVAELRSVWDGEAKEARQKTKAWRSRAEKMLRDNWNKALQREAKFRGETGRACAPITEPLTAETIDNILARFSGQHLKDMIASRASFPSFVNGVAFYARSRGCEISGSPDEARLRFPLWGTGKKATEFHVAPCGASAGADWRKLVADASKRENIVSMESLLKDKATPEAKKKKITRKLEQMRAMKMGRVGIVYNERRRKWFALVSWTRHQPDVDTKGQKAAVNFGVNVFMQALAEDGTTWSVDGDQIIHKRQAWAAIRRRIQRSQRLFGSGSKGRGKRRRELPLTKRRGDESNWMQTYIRQLAAELIEWCQRHGVADLYIEDLADIREQFELATEGQAHEEVKRRIHSWPFYETAQAIARQGAEQGVRVHLKAARYVSQRCPTCKHTSPDNIHTVERATGPVLELNGKRYREVGERWTRFECQNCGLKGHGDLIASANHLVDVGATHALEKQQEKARVRVTNIKRATKESLNGRNGNGSSNGHEKVQRSGRADSRGAPRRRGGRRDPVHTSP